MTRQTELPLRSLGFRAFLATQFLGAFNDNLFKLLICFLAARVVKEGQGDRLYIPLAGAMLTLPFLIFSAWAGHVADHFSKKRVMVWVKVAEIVIMSAGFVAFYLKCLPLLLGLLFLMGAQSAFFGPAKYGFLPETLPSDLLSRGNGHVQMWTFVAIVLGGASSGGLAYLSNPDGPLGSYGADLHWAAAVCIAVAVTGTLTSLWITPTPAAAKPNGQAGRGLPAIWQTLRDISEHRILRRCVAGTAYFWFLAALFQLNILLYAQNQMGASERFVGLLQATVALGIGLGSAAAGRISGDHIEFRLVPLGALGMGLFSCLLLFLPGHPYIALATLACLGASAGFFNLPLATAIQRYSPPGSRGRYLGTNNFVTFSAMTLAAGILALVLLPPFVQPSHVFMFTGLSALAVLVVMFRREPSFLSRFAMWAVPAPFYKLSVEGAEHIPESGGALLVCNHISFADAPLVQSALRRPIRFLMHKSFYEQPFFRFFGKRLRCISITDQGSPRELISSLREATEAIKDGDLVCIFAESMISRLGVLLPFRRGIEVIMRRLDAPIIPVALGGLWGDQLSFRWGAPGQHGLWRWLNRPLRWPVTARIGKPLPADTPSWAVRERVGELLLAADEPTPGTSSPGLLLLRHAKGLQESKRYLPPSCRPHLLRRAVDAIACARQLRSRLRDHDHVAVSPELSPSTAARACDTLALLGKTIDLTGDPANPSLGTPDFPLSPSFSSRLSARISLRFLPARSLLRRLGMDHARAARHILCRTADHAYGADQILEAARRFSDAFRLTTDDDLAFLDPSPPPFAPWCSLFSGCRIGNQLPGTILIADPAVLAGIAISDWRLVISLGPLAPDQRTALETSLGQPVHTVVLADDGITPLIAELPDAVDGSIRQDGQRPGSAGLPVPGTRMRTIGTDGTALSPGASGTLEIRCREAGKTTATILGPGTIDADGFVTTTTCTSLSMEEPG